MIDLGTAIQRLCIHEGIRLEPYKCPAGYLTIGVGRNLDTNPITEEEKKVVGDWRHGITKNAAFYLLRNDIKRVEKECRQHIPFWKTLDDERQYALLDMVFCQGLQGVLKYKKMLAAMGVGNWTEASQECLNSLWHSQAKNRCERIANTIKTGVFVI